MVILWLKALRLQLSAKQNQGYIDCLVLDQLEYALGIQALSLAASDPKLH